MMYLFFGFVWLNLLCLVNQHEGGPGNTPFVNCSTPANTTQGQDAVLLCHLEPRSDATKYTVEWKFKKLPVHVYRSGGDDPSSQDQKYNNRTSLINAENGNLSLKLLNVTKKDEGNYTCYVPQLSLESRKCNVTLNVDGDGGANKQVQDKRDSGGAHPKITIKVTYSFIVIVIFSIGLFPLIIPGVIICEKQTGQRNNSAGVTDTNEDTSGIPFQVVSCGQGGENATQLGDDGNLDEGLLDCHGEHQAN